MLHARSLESEHCLAEVIGQMVRAAWCLMRIEPLPDIRDGILVERLVKSMRYVADMRRCQYVVQRPEGVRRRQRLNVEYVDRRAGDLLVPQHADQSLFVDDRPARRIDQQGRW